MFGVDYGQTVREEIEGGVP